LVGSLRRLDRKHVVVGDDDRLPDVEGPHDADERKAARDVGKVAFGRTMPAERSLRDENFRRDFMRAKQLESILLEDARDAGEKMVIAAAKKATDARQIPQRDKVRMQLGELRPQHGPDDHDIAATGRPRQPAKPAELAETRPVMP